MPILSSLDCLPLATTGGPSIILVIAALALIGAGSILLIVAGRRRAGVTLFALTLLGAAFLAPIQPAQAAGGPCSPRPQEIAAPVAVTTTPAQATQTTSTTSSTPAVTTSSASSSAATSTSTTAAPSTAPTTTTTPVTLGILSGTVFSARPQDQYPAETLIELLDSTGTVVATQVSVQHRYRFVDLTPGDYSVRIAALVDSRGNQGATLTRNVGKLVFAADAATVAAYRPLATDPNRGDLVCSDTSGRVALRITPAQQRSLAKPSSDGTLMSLLIDVYTATGATPMQSCTLNNLDGTAQFTLPVDEVQADGTPQSYFSPTWADSNWLIDPSLAQGSGTVVADRETVVDTMVAMVRE